MKIVQFEDGKYGVRCGWFFGWNYLSSGGYTFREARHVKELCKMHTFTEACDRMNSCTLKHKVVLS